MTKIKLFLSLFITLFFCSVWVSSSQAQSPELVIINFVAAEEQEESMALSVFFTLTDGSGRPVPQANIDSATIQLLGTNNEPVPAIVEDPQTPVFITLLIDASGSMQGVIGDVRDAARSAIDMAPPTAHFAVIQFNETSEIVENFTNDHNRIKSAIDIIDAAPNKGTCLYDSVYDAIGLLDSQIQNPQERRAIILFTDGKDQLNANSDAPCSRHTYNDVINAARPANLNAPITPIHTIGLFDAQGRNLNEAELRGMATDTIAFSAIGGQTNLNSLFQEIIGGLNSQLVARANVFPNQGENQAVLSVMTGDSDVPLTTTFNFFSSKDYDLPPPPVGIQIGSLQYDSVNDVYLLSLSVASAESIHQIIVNVWDTKRGTQVSVDQIFEGPEPTFVVELDTSNFEPGREYSIHLQATDEEGFLITNEDGETLLTEREIVYEPEQAEAVEFTIQAVNADYENGLLYIDLDVAEPGRIQLYEGFIVDESTGGKIHDFGPTPFTGNRIQELLPEAIQLSETAVTYRVTVYLTTGEQLRSEATYDDFKPVPPTPPGLMSRIMTALSANPAIMISIIVIVLAILAWFMIRNRQNEKQEKPVPRPPVDKTNIYMPSIGKQRVSGFEDWLEDEEELFLSTPAPASRPSQATRLRVTVIQAPGQSLGLEKIITSFPCLIGREGCQVNIVGDRRISRRHVEITIQGKDILITDLGSRNGTFLGDQKLTPQTPTILAGSQMLRLGSQTHLKLELLST